MLKKTVRKTVPGDSGSVRYSGIVLEAVIWFIVVAALVLSSLLMPDTASAQAVKGKTCVGLQVDMLDVSSHTSRSDQTVWEISVGPLAPRWFSELRGLPPLNLDLAYGASDSIVVGAFTSVGIMSLQSGDDSDSSSIARIALMPHVDFLMSPGSAFRPFVGLLGGVTHVTGQLFDDDDSSTFVSIGASLGGYSFVTESLSMGPRLALTYTPGIGGDADGTSVFAAQGLFHISGWM